MHKNLPDGSLPPAKKLRARFIVIMLAITSLPVATYLVLLGGGDQTGGGVTVVTTPDESVVPASDSLSDVPESIQDTAFRGLEPRARALQFYALASRDTGSAVTLLEASREWLSLIEFDALAAILIEEVVRSGGGHGVEILSRLAGQGGDRTDILESLLRGIADTPELTTQTQSFLTALVSVPDPDIAATAKLVFVSKTLEEDGFPAALDVGLQSGLLPVDEDPLFEALVARASRSAPEQVLAWLQAHEDSTLQDAFLPFVISQWAWKNHDAAGAWLTGLPDSPFRDRAVTEFATTIQGLGSPDATGWASLISDSDTREELLVRLGESPLLTGNR